jgi:hypothetical protein
MSINVVLLFVVLLWVSAGTVQAQRGRNEFVATETHYTQGKVLPLRNNQIQITRHSNEAPLIYNLSEIAEYGYDGKVYESLKFNGERKFFRRLVSGNVKLYKIRGGYMLRKDSTLAVFNRHNFRTVMPQFIPCEGDDYSKSRLSYSRFALRKFVTRSNDGQTCDYNRIPHSKFGAYGGLASLNFQLSDLSTRQRFSFREQVAIAGVFLDLPLYRPNTLFLTTELYWMHSSPTFFSTEGANTGYLKLEMNNIVSGIHAKWLLSNTRLKPYLKAGGVVALQNIDCPSGILSAKANGNVVEVIKRDMPPTTKFGAGYSAACGFEYLLRGRKSLHMELKYINSFSQNLEYVSLNYSGLFVVAGFNI